jgi:type IV pilus assembly protein PilM
MLGKNKDYLAVVIGESAINAAHLRGIGANQKVVGLARESLDGIDPAQWDEKIRSILSGFRMKKPAAICVIPSAIVTTKNIEIPSLDKEEIRSIIDLQAGRHTPYSREEILISYVSVGVFQRNYTKVLLVIANRNVIKARLDACEMAGLRVEKVVFAPECIAKIYAELLNIDSKDDPLGIIDITHSATDFIVEHNQTVATCRNIPIGMRDLLAEGQAGKERLVNELVQSLEVYRNEDINKMPARYVLTSDAPVTGDLMAMLQQRLNAEVRNFVYTKKILQDPADVKMNAWMEDDSFVSAVSAAHLFHQDFQVDLMPDEVKNQRAIEDQGRQVIMAGIFSIILLLMICGSYLMKVYFRNIHLQKLREEYVLKRYVVVHLDKIAHRTRIVKDFLVTRMVSLDVIGEIYRIVPNEMYLQNIFLDEEGTINIQGISEAMSTVFNVVKALEDSKLFKNVETRSTTATKDRGKDVAAFDIVFKLETVPDEPVGTAQADTAAGEDQPDKAAAQGSSGGEK